MKMNELTNKNATSGLRIIGILAILSLCCIALVPAVAATYPDDKWLITPNRTVLANTSNYAIIDGVQWKNQDFFGVVGNGHYNTSILDKRAYNWTKDPKYPNPPYRYYMEQLQYKTTWYPANMVNLTKGYQWEFINNLTPWATIYKKGLAGYVDPQSGTYYAWYGNKTNAAAGPYHNSSWYCLTYDNATYIVNLTELYQ